MVVDESVTRSSRIGYFAAMYRRVTQAVKDGISRGDFEDGERMSHFDALFAEHYFRALDAFQAGGELRRSWSIAFEATQSRKPLILQHLLLGMNAHIYLDLGIAAAEAAPGPAYAALQNDFRRINDILFEQLDPTENRVGEHSPWLGLADYLLGSWDEWLAKLALQWLRESAWEFGASLAKSDREGWPELIRERDAMVAKVARGILDPGFPLSWVIPIVRFREDQNTARVIVALS